MPTKASAPPAPTAVTVNLSPRSVDALLRASRASALGRTDTINRAIQVYDFVLNLLSEDTGNTLVVMRDGKAERIDVR
jgi:hypothetical protein